MPRPEVKAVGFTIVLLVIFSIHRSFPAAIDSNHLGDSSSGGQKATPLPFLSSSSPQLSSTRSSIAVIQVAAPHGPNGSGGVLPDDGIVLKPDVALVATEGGAGAPKSTEILAEDPTVVQAVSVVPGKKPPGVLPFGNAASPKFLGIVTSGGGGGGVPIMRDGALLELGGSGGGAFSCAKLQSFHLDHFQQVISKVDFKGGPRYNMPWYYDDPTPLCGRYMLEFINQFGAGAMKPETSTTTIGAGAWLLHRLQLPVSVVRAKIYASDTHTLTLDQGAEAIPLPIEQCGRCAGGGGGNSNNGANCTSDVLITARLVGQDGFASVPVTTDSSGRSVVQLSSMEAGQYQLEVKLVHWDGLSDNPRKPKSLGVIGIRTFENKHKSYRYNNLCDQQRHVYGSPINIQVNAAPPVDDRPVLATALTTTDDGTAKGVAVRSTTTTEFCTEANHTEGRWVRWTKSEYMCSSISNRSSTSSFSSKYCEGNPLWLSDACAYNKEMLWTPKGCKYHFYLPPKGPPKRCIRAPGRGFLMMVGDSVTREYGMNCKLFDLSAAGLTCMFNNIALEGKHYSTNYALDVAKVIVTNVKTTNPSVFATNLGIHHMIGPCSTAQWTEFVDLFVTEFKKSIKLAMLTESSDVTSNADNHRWKLKGSSRLEQMIWLGPPTIHYARLGMGAQRAARWDAIAWERLEPLGFKRLYAIAPTASRQEGTWDGLHYAAAKGKLQAPWVNRQAKVLPWNGGIANMLFTMMLNLVCN